MTAGDLMDEISTRAVPRPAALEHTLSRFRSGEPVILGLETGSLIVFGAAVASSTSTAAAISHGSGLIFVALTRQRLRELRIPAMPAEPGSLCPDTHVAVDAATGIGTGISAHDRAQTIRLLADAGSAPDSFHRPGHVIPVAADLRVGTIATAPQVVLMLAALSGGRPEAAAFTSLVSVADPCGLATPGEGVQIAARLGRAYIDSDIIAKSFYWL